MFISRPVWLYWLIREVHLTISIAKYKILIFVTDHCPTFIFQRKTGDDEKEEKQEIYIFAAIFRLEI